MQSAFCLEPSVPARKFARVFRPDPRDSGFLMERKLPTVTPVGKRLWPVPPLYDQGQTPACTGFGWSNAMSATMYADLAGANVVFNALALYEWANKHDGDPTPHEGSTVRAAAIGLVQVGDQVMASTSPADAVGAFDKINNYLWANVGAADADIDRITTWLLQISPVVIGINWYDSMMDPDPATGILRVDASGNSPGGHAICVRGVDATDPNHTMYVVRNSWGRWGVTVRPDFTVDTATPGGDALLSKADLVRLLRDQGEAGALVDNLAPVPSPSPSPVPSPVPSPSPAPSPAPTPSPLLQQIEQAMAAFLAEVRHILGVG